VTTITPKANFSYQDMHIGFAARREGEKVTKTFAQAVYHDKENLYWGRADLLAETFSTGCMIDEKHRIHSHELVYSWVKDFKGIKGFPVELNNGGEYECNDKTNLGWTLKVGEHISYAHEVSHKVDKNWTLGMVQQFDNSRKGTKLPMYDVGFKASYKL
jgi:hypothetical protein